MFILPRPTRVPAAPDRGARPPARRWRRLPAALAAVLLAALLGTGLAQTRGGTATVLLPEDIPTLNPYLSTALITSQVAPAIVEPLLTVNPAGEYVPVMAARVPTPENGDVSPDGLRVTWTLKPGLTWSDGVAVTADDVVFTYEAATQGANSVRGGLFAKVVSVTAVDDSTAVVEFSEFDSSYLDLFQYGILPRHATGELADMSSWAFNRDPVGTGPFVLGEWRAGDRIIMERNERYRDPAKPYLDRLVYMVVPSEETRVAMMVRGDAERMLWPGANQRDALQASGNVDYVLVPSIYILRMFLNLGERGNPVIGQAPHPILGDLRVRQALAYAIDYDSIIDGLAEGRVQRANSPFELGWYTCEVDGYDYDPDRAAQLLDEAGWVMGSGGVRVAKGAKYAADGTRLSLDVMGYTDFRLLEQTELVISDMYKSVGVELNVRNVEQSVLFGGWADGAARKTGDFDILMYDTGAGINPQAHVYDLLASSRIPTEENGGVGGNYSRWSNPQVDAWLDEAGSSPSLTVRKADYCNVAEAINEELPQIYLYQFADGSALSVRLKGVNANTWAGISWDVADWYLE